GLLTGSVIVAFEYLYADGVEVAAHAEINDENQTVYRPAIETDAYNFDDPGADLPWIGGTVQDQVSYVGLREGETYLVTGELYDSGTGEPTGITGETTFEAEAESGVVLVDFEVPNNYAGASLVVFE